MSFEKLLVPAFHQDKQPECAPVQFGRGVSGARGRNACRQEQFAGDLLGNIAAILDGVVQMNLLQTMETLPFGILVEVQGEGRLAVDRAKAAEVALEMKGDVCVTLLLRAP